MALLYQLLYESVKDFPNSQHRPVVIEVGYQIQTIRSIPKARWNFHKANWSLFTKTLDDNVRWIPPCTKNYKRFTKLIINTSKKHIPRGYRKNYVPGWNYECETLYTSFKRLGNYEYAKKTLDALNNQRRERWIQLVEKTDFKHSSRKAWSLIRRLGSNREPKRSHPPINPNHIANHILGLSRASPHKQFSKETKTKLAKLKRGADKRSGITAPFTIEEINSAITKIKTGKSVSNDGIFLEFYKHCRVRTRSWLTALFNNILERFQQYSRTQK